MECEFSRGGHSTVAKGVISVHPFHRRDPSGYEFKTCFSQVLHACTRFCECHINSVCLFVVFVCLFVCLFVCCGNSSQSLCIEGVHVCHCIIATVAMPPSWTKWKVFNETSFLYLTTNVGAPRMSEQLPAT